MLIEARSSHLCFLSKSLGFIRIGQISPKSDRDQRGSGPTVSREDFAEKAAAKRRIGGSGRGHEDAGTNLCENFSAALSFTTCLQI